MNHLYKLITALAVLTLLAPFGIQQTQAGFAEECATSGGYGPDNIFMVELVDAITGLRSENCVADDWTYNSATFNIFTGTPIKQTQEVIYIRDAGGSVNVRAIRNGVYTADNWITVPAAGEPTPETGTKDILRAYNGATSISVKPGQSVYMEITDSSQKGKEWQWKLTDGQSNLGNCQMGSKTRHNMNCLATGSLPLPATVEMYAEVGTLKTNTVTVSISNDAPTNLTGFADRCATYGSYGTGNTYSVELVEASTGLTSSFCSADGWNYSGPSMSPFKTTGDQSPTRVVYERMDGGSVNVRAFKKQEWTDDNYLMIAAEGQPKPTLLPFTPTAPSTTAVPATTQAPPSTTFAPQQTTQAPSNNTNSTFSQNCETVLKYGAHNTFYADLVDSRTKQRSYDCVGDYWEHSGDTNALEEIQDASQMVIYNLKNGGRVNIRAVKGGKYTKDNWVTVKRGTPYVKNIGPKATSTAFTYLQMEDLRVTGFRDIFGYHYSALGSKDYGLLLTAKVSNVGKRDFDVTEDDPLNVTVFETPNKWGGSISCGDAINPVAQQFEGTVLTPSLKSGTTKEAQIHLFKGKGLEQELNTGKTIACQIYPLGGYGNIQVDQFPSQQYRFDLSKKGNKISVSNFRLETEGYKTPTENLLTSTTTVTSTIIPPAGYEDEVITNFQDFTNPFPDTSMASLAGQAPAELYRRGVLGGFPDGEFKGDREVNRAEAAKFLLLAREHTIQQNASNPFWDVKETEWYGPYVLTAANLGIINGHPDKSFRPGDGVNTVEFLKMLNLTFGVSTNQPHSYADVSENDWFNQYSGIALTYNLFPNRNLNYLEPGKKLTREEVAVAIYQYLSQR